MEDPAIKNFDIKKNWKQLPGTESWIISYESDGDNEDVARVLSEIHEDICVAYKLIILRAKARHIMIGDYTR